MNALRDLVERERHRAKVPGCAVAVVQRGEVVLCEGFGHRQLAPDQPVTTQTLFPIGSATKTFTAALIAAGQLDAPLKQEHPDVGMLDPEADRLLSMRDCLAHRSGLPRHDLVWLAAEPGVTRDQLVRQVKHLAPNAPFRASYQYNNLLYIVAGHLAARQAGSTFEHHLQAEILDPLGMTRTTPSSHVARADADCALPYVISEETGSPASTAWVPLDLAGPAGSLNSCADDLARWLLWLCSSPLQEMRRPVIAMPERWPDSPIATMGYGLGLMVESYRGRSLTSHGGNIDGFSAQVLTRDDGVGIAVLTNLHTTWLRDALPYQLLDALDGVNTDWDHGEYFARRLDITLAPLHDRTRRLVASSSTGGRARLLGTYANPGYGTLAVKDQGGRLCWSLHGLTGGLAAGDGARVQVSYPFFGTEVTAPGELVCAASGEVRALHLKLEPAAPPVEFLRSDGGPAS
jgi:CubicO group peptidase (beta-lactamase class C family)